MLLSDGKRGVGVSGPRVFRRVLVANRGEIAVRVIRTCRRLGIETVLAVSDADAASMPARLADKVIRIGPAPAADSYLNVDAVVGAALAAGVDAVHPGYGFLSENARLARACAAAGIVFIGPAPETLEAAGDKLAAREHATAAGLPVLPGGHVGLAAYPATPERRGSRATTRWATKSGGSRGTADWPQHGEPRALAAGSGIRCWSRRPAAVAGAGCGWCGTRRSWLARSPSPARRRGRRSGIPGCTWSATSSAGAMLRCRSWATGIGSSTWATGTARSSGVTRS